MRKIVYYVATSLDGYIAGKDNDVSMFSSEGEGVEQYFYDLESYDTVIMGRNTYEFGYQYGLEPGEPAYANMEHFIFSNHMKLEKSSDLVHVVPLELEFLNDLKSQIGSDIYLCGGGMFAGWLLKNGLIDEIKLKVNPLILGDGVRLFGNYDMNNKLDMVYQQSYDDGMQISTYQVI